MRFSAQGIRVSQHRAQDHILFVDLDNTLTRSDLFLEPLLRLLRQDPVVIFLIPVWLVRGRRFFKQQLVERINIDVADLAYDQAVIDHISSQRSTGSRIVLATASHHRYARQIADHLGLFDDVIGSTPDRNTKGKHKLAVMRQLAGPNHFDYLGDSHADIPIWQFIGRARVVSPQPGVLQRLARRSIPAEMIHEAAPLKSYLNALRPWQWLKNLLVFVPLILAKQLFDPAALAACVLAFISFSLCASAGYLVNDLLDLDADRQHPRKKCRSVASGELPLWNVLVLALLLVLTSLALAVFVSIDLALLLLGYFVMAIAYSLELKQHAIIDVLLLAGFYTARLLAGAVAAQVPISFWLLAFSIFLFLSLAILKRCTEMRMVDNDQHTLIPGRGYSSQDEPLLFSMGITSGYLSVVVIALYIHSEEVTRLYTSPQVLWIVCPLVLYWISRMWLKTARNMMDDDPIIFAMRDKVSLVTGLLLVLVMMLATV